MKHPDKLALFTYLSYFYDIFHDKDPVSFHSNSNPLESPPAVHLMPSSPPSRSWNTKLTLARPVTKETDVKLKRVVMSRAVSPQPTSVFRGGPVNPSDKCYFCQKVYLMERQSAQGIFFHRSCFRCYHCNSQLKTGNYSYSHGSDGGKGCFYCTPHFKQLFLSNPKAINYASHHNDGALTTPVTITMALVRRHRKVQFFQRMIKMCKDKIKGLIRKINGSHNKINRNSNLINTHQRGKQQKSCKQSQQQRGF